jgi:hypothetical protein
VRAARKAYNIERFARHFRFDRKRALPPRKPAFRIAPKHAQACGKPHFLEHRPGLTG